MQVAFDEFRGNGVTAPPGVPYGPNGWRPIVDVDKEDVRLILGFDVDTSNIKDIKEAVLKQQLLFMYREHSFDSAQCWLRTLEWDGVPRVKKYLYQYVGAPDTEYAEAISEYIWTALAGRIIEPGCKADMMPVYISPQGWGKSTGVEAMVAHPDQFIPLSLHNSDADLSRFVRGRSVIEIPELDGMTKRDVEWLKNFISKREEKHIPKFIECPVVYMRRCIFIGTSNRVSFLQDDTGNRRFLPIELESRARGLAGAFGGIAAARDQLWAEGAEMYRIHGVMYERAERLAYPEHPKFMAEDSWLDIVSHWLSAVPLALDGKASAPAPKDREFIRLHEVMQGALGLDAGRATSVNEKRAAAVLRRIGWQSVVKRVDGIQARVWRKG